MERQIGEVQDQIRRVQEELQQLDQVRLIVSEIGMKNYIEK